MKLLKLLSEQAQNMLSTVTYDHVASALGKPRFSAPNPDDSLRGINDEGDWEDWKSRTIHKWGDVEIKINPEANWFDQIVILDPAFSKAKVSYTANKAAWLDRERQSGRTSGLD